MEENKTKEENLFTFEDYQVAAKKALSISIFSIIGALFVSAYLVFGMNFPELILDKFSSYFKTFIISESLISIALKTEFLITAGLTFFIALPFILYQFFKLSELKKIAEANQSERNMNFLDHLGELRKRIILGLVGIVFGSVIGAILVFEFNFIDIVLLNSATSSGLKLQNLQPFGQPFLYFKVTLVLGIIVAFPFMLYQFWKFIAPGLYSNEKRWVRSITFFTSICFMIGVAFAYFLMIPTMLSFSASFGSADIENNIDINEYFSFIINLVLAAGLLFEMPMVTWVLSRVGILKPETLKKYRRHGIVIILIIAAIMTPTPDPVSQLVFALPLFVLYEISIIVSKITVKKREARMEEEENFS